MSLHFGPGAGSDEPDLMMDINTTPLIDVLLVLLVMLIITIPIQLHAVHLALPLGTPPASLVQPEKVQIDIDANSVVYWQGLVVGDAELDARMATIAQLAVQPEVHVRPSRDARYAVFVSVLATSRRNGLTRLAVIGSDQFLR